MHIINTKMHNKGRIMTQVKLFLDIFLVSEEQSLFLSGYKQSWVWLILLLYIGIFTKSYYSVFQGHNYYCRFPQALFLYDCIKLITQGPGWMENGWSRVFFHIHLHDSKAFYFQQLIPPRAKYILLELPNLLRRRWSLFVHEIKGKGKCIYTELPNLLWLYICCCGKI